MLRFIDRFFNQHKGFRRIMVLWACWLITVVVLRVTRAEVLHVINGSIASIVAAVIGILATAIAFYQWSRHKEDGND